MQTIVISTSVSLVTKDCAKCGITFAVPDELNSQLIKNGQTFYCPNGHPLWHGESEADRLRKSLLNAKWRVEQTEAELQNVRQQRDGALRQVSAHKGVITKMKFRIQNGICPDCHRHFNNLERHMHTKHGK